MIEITVTKDVQIRQIERYVWEVVRQGEMRVPGRIYTNRRGIEELADEVRQGKAWNALQQVINVASLPGIQVASLAMADVHPGYGFPIGGVGAFDLQEGVVSVAGVGYDINCGVRTLRTTLHRDEVEPHKVKLADALYRTVPAGLGSKGNIHLTIQEMDKLLVKGAEWVVRHGYGLPQDLEYIEEQGAIAGADPATVSHKAKERELQQIGSLGSGNHYLEVQWVDEIYAPQAADAYGLFPGQILVSIHSGSRALGHQIGTDYLKVLDAASRKYGIPIRERELVCAPYDSPEGRQYLAAVRCGINVAFANRQALAHLAREGFHQALGVRPDEITTLYEIAHNTAKVEEHEVDGKRKQVIVHRKGATRAFGPGQPRGAGGVPQGGPAGAGRRDDGHVLVHPARHAKGDGRDLWQRAARRGARPLAQAGDQAVLGRDDHPGTGRAGHPDPRPLEKGVAEEAPGAYKDATEVVDIMHDAGIIRKVARVRPLICIKG